MIQRRNHPLAVSRKKEIKGNSLTLVALSNHLKKLKYSIRENQTRPNKQNPEGANTGKGAGVKEVSNNLKI